MAETEPTPPSSLLNYLPGIYREHPFLGEFLLAFEQILLKSTKTQPNSPDNTPIRGLEEIIATISDLFVPAKTPPEFLTWLASWVAFSVWSDISEAKQREFIANMMELYRWRGTEQNLKHLFLIFTGLNADLPDIPDNLEAYGYDLSLMSVTTLDGLLDKGSHLIIVALVGRGKEKSLHIRIFDADGKRVVDKPEKELANENVLTALKKRLTPMPDISSLSKTDKQKIIEDATLVTSYIQTHYFKVSLSLSKLIKGSGKTEAERQQAIDRQIEIAHALIQLEKPAHTRYRLELTFPSFRIGSQADKTGFKTQVGINTRLGVATLE